MIAKAPENSLLLTWKHLWIREEGDLRHPGAEQASDDLSPGWSSMLAGDARAPARLQDTEWSLHLRGSKVAAKRAFD